jgi:hypothetical protein
MEVRPAVLSGDYDFAVDQERVRLKASGGFDNGKKRSAQLLPFRVKQRTRRPSRRTIRR